MRVQPPAAGLRGGPFRLLKYFIISGFMVIAVVTLLLGAFLYTSSVDTLVKSAENYARLLAENLNYNIFNGFYAPLKAQGVPMDLRKWDQFGALDSLVKDFTYGLRIQSLRVIDLQRKIVYSTEYDLIGEFEPRNSPAERALNGQDVTIIRKDEKSTSKWYGNRQAETYYPLREGAGNYWMLGNIYGVIQITQDVTDQYVTVQRSIIVIMVVAAGLMGFLFVTLTLIVRRGEHILLTRAEEQKRLEEQLQQSEKLASIGQMVATIAHEIRNPLGIIRSSGEVLVRKADAADPARIRKLSGIIVEEATRLSSILTDFLEFARPRAPSVRDMDIREVLERVKTNLEEELTSRNIRWIDPQVNGFRPLVRGDADLLYQAFLNIAMNAFESMEPGGALALGLQPAQQFVRVDFADTGHGIKEEDLPKIFSPFFTTHEMGTGLGLSVVHNIVSAHHGEIRVDSTPGQGTVFSVYIPAGESSEDGPARTQ